MARSQSQKTIVSRLFANSARPIYLLDDARKIVFCNEALLQWLQTPAEALMNTPCVYSGTDDSIDSSMPNQLCPPPHAWERFVHVGRLVVTTAGRTLQRQALFVPIRDDADASMLVVVDASDADNFEDAQDDTDSLHRQIMELRASWSAEFTLDRLVGTSPAIRQVRSQVEMAVRSSGRVLIVGPAGVGRETIARTIHQHRAAGPAAPLVPLSCSVLDAELLESTVEAFVRRCAELADEAPGTLLLLDVDQLEPDAQAALLGFLEIPELELQAVSTSQRSLSWLVAEHQFRPDLACGLATLEINVPRLSDRMEDVPLLAQWLVEEENRASHKQLGGFTPEAMDSLLGYSWPGEVAELRAVVEAACTNAAGPLIRAEDLPDKLKLAADAAAVVPASEEKIDLDRFLADIESELMMRALRQAKGNKAQAARLLGISRARLLRRMEQLNVHRED